MELWDSIFPISYRVLCPWLFRVDFNKILNTSDKIGYVLMVAIDVEDFKDRIEFCDMTQIINKCGPFTYRYGRAGEDCIFEKLYRLFFSEYF